MTLNRYEKIQDIVVALGWDYQRMSQSGQEYYEELCNLLNIK
jgi:hypothetical protein